LSIRTRLTVGFLAIVAAVITVFGLAVYDLTRQSLLNELDDSVRDHAAALAVAAEPPAGQTLPQLPDIDMFNSPDTFVEIVDPSGNVLGASGNLGNQRLPFHLKAIQSDQVEDVHVGGRPLILYGRPIQSDGQLRGYVLVALAPSPIYLALQRLRNLLFPGAAAALLVAGIGSWLLVHSAITPLQRLAAGASRIRAEGDHGRRLNYSGRRDEIGKLAATIDAMLESLDEAHRRLQASSAAQRRFLADASHELRRPLTIALSSLDVLARVGSSDAEFTSRTLQDIHVELERMARTVTQLLAMARADSGARLDRQPVLVAESVREAVAQLKPKATGINIITPQLDAVEDAVVLGNREELDQVFLNVVDNAIKYTPQGGAISVSGSVYDGEIVITVHDTGIGISSRDLPHVFERFYRGEAANNQEGTGLGLAIVEHYVGQHGGRVSVDSRPGAGTDVTVILPLMTPEKSTEDYDRKPPSSTAITDEELARPA
jgi:two-component system, OmpR family, sensor kinase